MLGRCSRLPTKICAVGRVPTHTARARFFSATKLTHSSGTPGPAIPVPEAVPVPPSPVPPAVITEIAVPDVIPHEAPNGLVAGIEAGLQELHNLGLPWWAVILGGTAMLRVLVFPLQVKTLKMGAEKAPAWAKYAEFTKKTQQRIMELQGDKEAIEEVSKEYSQFNKEFVAKHGNPLGQFVPTLLQFPFYILYFFSIRDLCTNPAFHPQMAEGGALWFTNLTIPDPYYFIPIGCGIVSYVLIQNSMKMASANQQQSNPATLMAFNLMSRIFPVISAGFAAIFPAGLSLYFLGTSALAFVSVRILGVAAVRSSLGLPPIGFRPPVEESDVPPPTSPNANMWSKEAPQKDEETVFQEVQEKVQDVIEKSQKPPTN